MCTVTFRLLLSCAATQRLRMVSKFSCLSGRSKESHSRVAVTITESLPNFSALESKSLTPSLFDSTSWTRVLNASSKRLNRVDGTGWIVGSGVTSCDPRSISTGESGGVTTLLGGCVEADFMITNGAARKAMADPASNISATTRRKPWIMSFPSPAIRASASSAFSMPNAIRSRSDGPGSATTASLCCCSRIAAICSGGTCPSGNPHATHANSGSDLVATINSHTHSQQPQRRSDKRRWRTWLMSLTNLWCKVLVRHRLHHRWHCSARIVCSHQCCKNTTNYYVGLLCGWLSTFKKGRPRTPVRQHRAQNPQTTGISCDGRLALAAISRRLSMGGVTR